MAQNWETRIDTEQMKLLIPTGALSESNINRALIEVKRELETKRIDVLPEHKERRGQGKKKLAQRSPKKKAAKKKSSIPQGETINTHTKLMNALKAEFYLFMCTDDKRYAKLRTQVNERKGAIGVVGVGTISAYIGSTLGVTTAACIPYVALLLYSVVVMGKNALCKTWTPHV